MKCQLCGYFGDEESFKKMHMESFPDFTFFQCPQCGKIQTLAKVMINGEVHWWKFSL